MLNILGSTLLGQASGTCTANISPDPLSLAVAAAGGGSSMTFKELVSSFTTFEFKDGDVDCEITNISVKDLADSSVTDYANGDGGLSLLHPYEEVGTGTCTGHTSPTGTISTLDECYSACESQYPAAIGMSWGFQQ
jgi:hypothetical protein